jgi:hypothetical protein
LQNLREAIAGYRNSIQRQADEKKREAGLSFFVEYLERYYFLICFAVYIHTDKSSLEQLTNQGREALSNGCEHVRSSTASSAGLLLISLDSSPLDNER